MEGLVRLAARPIAFLGSALMFVGLVYLGIQLSSLSRGGGGELRKAVAMVTAGGVVAAFAARYGFAGF